MIRKRGGSLQVQVFAGRDPLTGRKRWLSRQVRGQTKAAWREAKLLVGRAGQPDTSLRSVCIAGVWLPPAAATWRMMNGPAGASRPAPRPERP